MIIGLTDTIRRNITTVLQTVQFSTQVIVMIGMLQMMMMM
jgi:hypothetical protein